MLHYLVLFSVFTDVYHFAKVGLTTSAVCLGGKVALDKPAPIEVTNPNGSIELVQKLSMIEKGIEEATYLIEEIDAKLLARFFLATQRKASEVSRIVHKAQLEDESHYADGSVSTQSMPRIEPWRTSRPLESSNVTIVPKGSWSSANLD